MLEAALEAVSKVGIRGGIKDDFRSGIPSHPLLTALRLAGIRGGIKGGIKGGTKGSIKGGIKGDLIH